MEVRSSSRVYFSHSNPNIVHRAWLSSFGSKICWLVFQSRITRINYRCKFSDSLSDSVIEIITYPPIFLLVKSCTFIFVILVVSESVARILPNLSARNVPNVNQYSILAMYERKLAKVPYDVEGIIGCMRCLDGRIRKMKSG